MLVKFAAPASGDPPWTGRERFPFLVSVWSRKSGKFMMVPSIFRCYLLVSGRVVTSARFLPLILKKNWRWDLTQYRQHVPERIPLDPFLAPRPLLWSMTFWKNQGRILVRNQMEFRCSPMLSPSFMRRLNVITLEKHPLATCDLVDILEAKVANLFFPLASWKAKNQK